MQEIEYRERKVQAAEMTAAALTKLAQVAAEYMALVKQELEEDRKFFNRK